MIYLRHLSCYHRTTLPSNHSLITYREVVWAMGLLADFAGNGLAFQQFHSEKKGVADRSLPARVPDFHCSNFISW